MSSDLKSLRKRLKNLRVGYTRFQKSKVKSVDFCANGKLFAYNNDEKITILTLDDKIKEEHIDLHKYGAGICKFFDPKLLLHTSSKKEGRDILRLLDWNVHHYSEYFSGHSNEVPPQVSLWA